MQKKALTRREFFSIARGYGIKTALFATTIGASSGLVPIISDFAVRDARAASGAKYRLRFGAGVMTDTNERHLCSGVYEFAKRVEEKSEGEVHIQIIDKAQSCAENTCGDRVINNIIQIGASSPQNLGSVMPYSIALDWPFLWKDRTGYHNFLFSKESNRLYRDVMQKAYGIVPLYGSGEMRNIMMGMKYKDSPLITSPADLAGAKIRITNSEMITHFTQSMKMSPIPLAWTELLEGLKSGVVDATETWPGAATGFGMHSVLSQAVGVEFSPGFEMIFISSKVYERFPDKIKLAFLEASYETMEAAYHRLEDAKNSIIGNGDNPSPQSAYQESGIKRARLSAGQLEDFHSVGGVEANAQIYSATRQRLDDIAGVDVYGALQEFEKSVSGKPLQPQKWWL